MKTNSPNQGRFLIAFLALAGIACVLWAISHYSGVAIHPYLLAGFRWAAIVALCGYSFVRRSLTPWIFAGMLLGAEIGHDLGQCRLQDLQVLSCIFLELVKTIVAPLIFGTLVVGIASHSNLKQVGRMGIKALLYFEVVTTVALFIGLGAINLTQAGVGVRHRPMLPRPASPRRRRNGLTLSCISFRKTLPNPWLKARCCKSWSSALSLALLWR